MSPDPARLPASMRALPTAQSELLVPSSSAGSFTPQELAAWRGLLEVHAHVMRQLDFQMQAAHGLTLSQCELLILLDDAPGQRMRMTELAEAMLRSRSRLTRLVQRLETLGYVTKRAATDDRRALYAQLTDTGRHVVTPARATHREAVRTAFLDQLRATDQVALGDIWARVRAGAFPSSDSTGRTVSQTAALPANGGTLMNDTSPAESKPPEPMPADDPGRVLTHASPDTDDSLPHLGVVGDTYTILVLER